ncbi:predicted protein [Postia placenta Mad-698-R]|nr:predicted protein [Postia placenta Mad-698-R]
MEGGRRGLFLYIACLATFSVWGLRKSMRCVVCDGQVTGETAHGRGGMSSSADITMHGWKMADATSAAVALQHTLMRRTPGVLWPITLVLATLATVHWPAGVTTRQGEAGHQSVNMNRVHIMNTCMQLWNTAAWASVMGQERADRQGWSTAHLAPCVLYHKCNICSRVTLSNIFRDKYGILISPTNIDRCQKKLNLRGSKVMTRSLSNVQKRQLVLDQLAKDPTHCQGPQIIKEGILFDTSLNFTHDYITSEMHIHDAEGFALRRPTACKVHREALVALEPHHEWSGDSHDKLSAIGFLIWGVWDKWLGKWLGLWVVLNNHHKDTIVFLYLHLIRGLSAVNMQ